MKLKTMSPLADSVNGLMMDVVKGGDITTLLKLVDLGARTDGCDVNGDPLLFTPIVDGNAEMLDILLTHGGSDPNASNDQSRTPLMLAVEMDDIRMIRRLIKAGARVNAIDDLGKTPLLLALEDGRFEIAEFLIKNGSDVNSVDDLGQSALFLTTRSERRDCSRIIRILLQCGYIIKEGIDQVSKEEVTKYEKQRERKQPSLVRRISLKMKRLPSFRSPSRIPNSPEKANRFR